MTKILSALVLVFLCSTSVGALSGERPVAVPATVDEIADPALRQALDGYSPNYKWLVRDNQIRDFVAVYKQLNQGREPALTADDAAALAAAQQPAVVVQSQTTVQQQPYYENDEAEIRAYEEQLRREYGLKPGEYAKPYRGLRYTGRGKPIGH